MPWLLLTLLHKGPEYGAELMWAKGKPARRTETSEQHLPHFQRLSKLPSVPNVKVPRICTDKNPNSAPRKPVTLKNQKHLEVASCSQEGNGLYLIVQVENFPCFSMKLARIKDHLEKNGFSPIAEEILIVWLLHLNSSIACWTVKKVS